MEIKLFFCFFYFTTTTKKDFHLDSLFASLFVKCDQRLVVVLLLSAAPLHHQPLTKDHFDLVVVDGCWHDMIWSPLLEYDHYTGNGARSWWIYIWLLELKILLILLLCWMMIWLKMMRRNPWNLMEASSSPVLHILSSFLQANDKNNGFFRQLMPFFSPSTIHSSSLFQD